MYNDYIKSEAYRNNRINVYKQSNDLFISFIPKNENIP